MHAKQDLREYGPLFVVLAIPVLAILFILLTEPGLDSALLFDGLKLAVLLILGGGAALAVGHYLFERTGGLR